MDFAFLFRFRTVRTVEVTDVHGAILYYFFCSMVIIYMVLYQLIYSYGYAATEDLSGFFTVKTSWTWGPSWEYYDGRIADETTVWNGNDTDTNKLFALSTPCNLLGQALVPCCINGNQNLFQLDRYEGQLPQDASYWTNNGYCYTESSDARMFLNHVANILEDGTGQEIPSGAFCPGHCVLDSNGTDAGELCTALRYCTRADAGDVVYRDANEVFFSYLRRSSFKQGTCYDEPVHFGVTNHTNMYTPDTTAAERADVCSGKGFDVGACEGLGCCDWDTATETCQGEAPHPVGIVNVNGGYCGQDCSAIVSSYCGRTWNSVCQGIDPLPGYLPNNLLSETCAHECLGVAQNGCTCQNGWEYDSPFTGLHNICDGYCCPSTQDVALPSIGTPYSVCVTTDQGCSDFGGGTFSLAVCANKEFDICGATIEIFRSNGVRRYAEDDCVGIGCDWRNNSNPYPSDFGQQSCSAPLVDGCPSDPDIAYIDGDASPCEGTLSGEPCTFECLEGYSATGDAVCSDGVWRNGSTCVAHGAACHAHICKDTCGTAKNGVCDDGGHESATRLCDYGTDCSDCSWRESAREPTEWTKRCDYIYWGTEIDYREATYPGTSEMLIQLRHAGSAPTLYPDDLFGLIGNDADANGEWVLEGYSEEEKIELTCDGCHVGVFKKFKHKSDDDATTRFDALAIADVVRSNKDLYELFSDISVLNGSVDFGNPLPSAGIILEITYSNYGDNGQLWTTDKVQYSYKVRLIADNDLYFRRTERVAGASDVTRTVVLTEEFGLRVTVQVTGDVKKFSFAVLFINIVAGAAVFAVAKILTVSFMEYRCDKVKREKFNELHTKHCLVDDGGVEKVEKDLYNILTCYRLRYLLCCAREYVHERAKPSHVHHQPTTENDRTVKHQELVKEPVRNALALTHPEASKSGPGKASSKDYEAFIGSFVAPTAPVNAFSQDSQSREDKKMFGR